MIYIILYSNLFLIYLDTTSMGIKLDIEEFEQPRA